MGRFCCHPSRTKKATYGMEGSKTADLCAEHAKGGMVDVQSSSVARADAPSAVVRQRRWKTGALQ